MKKLFMLSLAALVFALPCMHNSLLRRLSSPNLLPR